MLLSIIGNLFGQGDDDQTDTEGATDGQLSDGDSLLSGEGGGGMESDDDLFGGDAFTADQSGGAMEFDDADDGTGGVSDELTSRVEEMENDIGSLSSTVNTVQSENEKIGESLEDIEENIRKLLEVYEMVTQGVNPFVEGDSLSETFGAAEGSGDFGGRSLFDSADAEAEDGDGTDVANAEAEDFLDEELLDDGFDDEEVDDGTFGDEFEAETEQDEALSFEELKSEYDSGDADWIDDETESADETAFEDDDPFAQEEARLEEPTTAESEFGQNAERRAEPVDESPSANTRWPDDDRPYISSVPSAYDAESLAMDWIEYLIEQVGLNGTAQTIRFYYSVDWISESVEEYLRTLLNGFDGGPDVDDPEPASALGVDHKRSLWWIDQVAAPEKTPASFEEWLREETIAPHVDGADGGDERVNATGTAETTEQSAVDRNAERTESGSEHTADAQNGWEDQSTETDEGPLNERNAQRILIGESGTSSEPEIDHHDRPAVANQSADLSQQNVDVPQQNVDTESGRMIWVDSDVVRPESEIELRFTQDDYDRLDSVEYVHSVFDTRDGDAGEFAGRQDETTGAQRDEDVKPLVVPDERSDLDRWQVELVNSLFAANEETSRGQ